MSVAGVVLAAGAGSRMGQPKAELIVGGTRLLDRAVAVLREAGCDPVIAVVRAGTQVAGAETVVNPEPERGMRSSLQLGIDAAGAAEAVAVLLVDLPGVTVQAVTEVVAAWRPGRITVARAGGRRGHPSVMSPDLWRLALDRAGPDEGARALMASRPELIDEIEVAIDGRDLDTPEDVAGWDRR